MADLGGVKVQLTLTIEEMRDLVALTALARELLEEDGDEVPEIADDVAGLYFELMENIEYGGTLGDFEPE